MTIQTSFAAGGHPLAGPLPNAVWKQAVADFAAEHHLPFDDLLQGEPFVCNGFTFRLQYDFEVDPFGLVLMIELGDVPAESAHKVQLGMLSCNAGRPSALVGYYAKLPGTSRSVYCLRLDGRATMHLAAFIAAAAEALARSMVDSYFQMRDACSNPLS